MAVQSYLFVNYQNRRKMIWMFEKSHDFMPFSNAYCGYLLTDKDMNVYEMSRSCSDVCRLSNQIIAKYENQITRRLQLDDLFDFNTDTDIHHMLDDSSEQIVASKYDSYLGVISDHDIQMMEEHKTHVDTLITLKKDTLFHQFSLTNDNKQPGQGQYIVKVLSEVYSNGFLEMRIVAIKTMV